jgi:hypothetical protein
MASEGGSVMESKSALFAKGTALREQLEAKGYKFIDIPVTKKKLPKKIWPAPKETNHD